MILGIDEVGRGCWAGPLVAGAVILDAPIPGLTDSKKLSKKRREQLDIEIRLQAVDFGLGWVTPVEVDKLGLTEAVRLAMRRAVEEIASPYAEIIIDGNYNYLPDMPNARFLVRADASIPAVSAASILAKVARDAYMTKIAPSYPEYQFDKHVGYGTAAHTAALKLHGVCALHRKSYAPIRAFLEQT